MTASSLPDYDSGIIAKLERAVTLIEDLQAMQADLRKTRTDPKYESHNNIHEDSNPIVWVEWRLTEAPDPLPLAFSALLGDVIHNLRSALDYCAWAAVDDRIRNSKPREVAFPLHDDPKKFSQWRSRKASWYAEPTMKAIEWAQPFKASPTELHPLRILQQLSNTDKHRLLNVVQYALVELSPVGITPEPPVMRHIPGPGGNVNVGDTLTRVEFPRPTNSGEIEVRPSFGWYETVAYKTPDGQIKPLRINEMVNSICSFTVTAVEQMDFARQVESGEIEDPEDDSR